MNYTEFEGRFFISPLIGCKGMCIYCYLTSEGIKNGKIRKNSINIKEILKRIKDDTNYIEGEKGSIISIGAYCDIFPLNEKELIDFSIDWIIESLKLNNPVQIISKNAISEDTIKKIASNIQFKNQLLYSTTITTFNYSSIIERHTSSPYERLKVLESMKRYDIPTNIMIKPFIPGVTNKEKEIFLSEMKNVDYCVIGEFYIPNFQVMKYLEDLTGVESLSNNQINSVLDCSSKEYKSIYSVQIDEVSNYLTENGIKVFNKSSCVNSNILKVNNPAGYFKKKNYCINCGNCS